MSEEKKIYLDEEGLEEYLREIRELEDKLYQTKKEKVNAGKEKTHDGFHDNFEYEQARREQDMISSLIQQKKAALLNIVIIKREETEDIVDLGNYVSIEVLAEGKEPRAKIIKLTGSSSPKLDDEIHEVTINSPLGKAVYKKKVGEEDIYKVNERVFKVRILSKSNNLSDLTENKKVNKR